MSGKQKPLPPRSAKDGEFKLQRRSEPNIITEMIDKVEREKAPKPVQSESPVARPQNASFVPLSLPKVEHRAVFCQADEGAFGALAATMELDGWELVSTESCQRHVSTANGAGMAHGWMTFWKRIKKEKAS